MPKPFLIDVDNKFVEVIAGEKDSRIPLTYKMMLLLIPIIDQIRIDGFEDYLKKKSEK